ncbi:MAG: NUDIX domain-containing protein [Treponema sp.]|nr:NUDIX domain-containing protein [Treponema sp.]
MAKTSVAGIAVNGSKVLIAHRNPTGQMGGRWEFPGGKVDGDESDTEALSREYDEEFGIEINVGKQIASASFEHNGETVNLHAYEIHVPHDGTEKKYELTEHSEYRWADINEIENLNFVDSDMKLYPDVKKFVLGTSLS